MDIEGKSIEVSMAGVKVSCAPNKLITRGLGSCVGITLYDPIRKIGGLAHPMLPDINNARIKSNPAKFVSSAIELILEELKKNGASVFTLRAKLFGGGHMFSAIPTNSPFNIGIKNANKAKEILSSLKIKILVDDTGGNYGRTIELDLSTGKVRVKTLFHGERVL